MKRCWPELDARRHFTDLKKVCLLGANRRGQEQVTQLTKPGSCAQELPYSSPWLRSISWPSLAACRAHPCLPSSQAAVPPSPSPPPPVRIYSATSPPLQATLPNSSSCLPAHLAQCPCVPAPWWSPVWTEAALSRTQPGDPRKSWELLSLQVPA